MSESTWMLRERIVKYAAAGYSRSMIAGECGITRAELLRHLKALDIAEVVERRERVEAARTVQWKAHHGPKPGQEEIYD